MTNWRQMFREAEEILADARRRARRAQPGARPDARRAAVGRDRQGDLAQRPRPHHGRADRVALRPRGRPALQAGPGPARPGRRDPLRQPPHGGGLRDRRHGHGLPRRPADLDPSARRGDAASAIADMVGREIGLLQPRAAGQPRRRCPLRPRSRPRGRLRGRQLRRPSRRGARLRRPDRRRPHRCRPGPLRHRAGDRRDHRPQRQGAHHPFAARGDGERHRLPFRGSPPARPVAADVDRRQHLAAGAQALPQPLRACPHRKRAGDRGGLPQAAGDPHARRSICRSPSSPAATSRR